MAACYEVSGTLLAGATSYINFVYYSLLCAFEIREILYLRYPLYLVDTIKEIHVTHVGSLSYRFTVLQQ